MHIDGSVQERHTSIANTLELHLSCTNPWILHIQNQSHILQREVIWGSLAVSPYHNLVLLQAVWDPLCIYCWWWENMADGDCLVIWPGILTHWGQVMHICISNLTIIGSDNGLSPGRRQAIIWTNDGLLLIGTLGTNFSEILIEIQIFSFNKFIWKYRLWNGSHFVQGEMS